MLRGAGARYVPLFLQRCGPPAATTITSTLLRTTTAVLSHSLASFNCQAFRIDPLSRSPAERSKTAEVLENISCERNLFPRIHLCELCVIPRSLVPRSGYFFRWRCTINFWRSSYQTNSPPVESTPSSWHSVWPPSFTTSIAATNTSGITPVADRRRPFRPPAKPPCRLHRSCRCYRSYSSYRSCRSSTTYPVSVPL